jgi:hypothetical protein
VSSLLLLVPISHKWNPEASPNNLRTTMLWATSVNFLFVYNSKLLSKLKHYFYTTFNGTSYTFSLWLMSLLSKIPILSLTSSNFSSTRKIESYCYFSQILINPYTVIYKTPESLFLNIYIFVWTSHLVSYIVFWLFLYVCLLISSRFP